MNKMIRWCMELALVAFFAGALCFSQSSGEAIYKAKCLNCHGADGLASSGIGRLMKVKPVTDPAIRKMTVAEMIALTQNGAGKMQAYKNELTSEEIKSSVNYFRTFIK